MLLATAGPGCSSSSTADSPDAVNGGRDAAALDSGLDAEALDGGEDDGHRDGGGDSTLPDSADGSAPRRRPNIIFLLADDMGWMDTTVTGSQYYETPSMDRLAREGVRFLEPKPRKS